MQVVENNKTIATNINTTDNNANQYEPNSIKELTKKILKSGINNAKVNEYLNVYNKYNHNQNKYYINNISNKKEQDIIEFLNDLDQEELYK